MSTKGVVIKKGALGPNRLGGADSTSGILLQGVEVAGKIALGVAVVLSSAREANAIGLDAAYDAANKVQVFHHIDEFFRMAGDGTKLHLMLVPQAKTMTMLADITDVDDYARKLIVAAKGEIRQLAIGLNPAPAYAATILNGLDDDVFGAIPKAQGLAEWGLETFRPFNVLLEGRDFTGPVAAAADLRAIENVKATKVSVVIGQDWAYAETRDAIGKKYAAIGTALGTLAAARINQNIGEVEAFNITDATKSKWLTAGLSGHQVASALEADWESLDEKGYLFGQTYTGLDGVRWNNDHVCAPVERDADGKINEHTISLGRTSDKAIRKLRTALLPKVKSVVPIDPATGQLPVGTQKYFEGLGDDELEVMETASEISAGKTYVDPTSDLLTVPRILKIGFSVVPYGTIDSIEGTLNLKETI